ncbi:LCP family protein [Agrilactobacillus yilanensis]|uniref:LCP family protein n=1 Tax=Agrilactobacillus yilanensis TaxID=2485997 RepID=A0ABW4J5V8_9LACO|nr:LCP family protein [Agrilactobacillus yilanensis]
MTKKLKYFISIGLICFLLLITSFCLIKIRQTQQAFDKISTANADTNTAITKQQPFTILLLGVDTGAQGRIDQGNSDTMLVASVNPQTHRTILYSIPRDTMAEMIGTKTKNVQKINAAYNIGGSKMAKDSVSALLGLPIDYYATLNMGGLEKLVDAVGGISVKVPFSWQDSATGNQKFEKGWTHLNGSRALAYVRMRHEDPAGDYGRQLRQQQVIKALAKKLLSFNSLSHYQTLLNYLQTNLKTDLVFDDVTKMLLKDHQNFKTITTYQLKGSDAWINNSSYQIMATKTLQTATDRLRSNLDLPAKTLKNTETELNALNTDYDGLNNLNYQTFGLDTQYYTNNTY